MPSDWELEGTNGRAVWTAELRAIAGGGAVFVAAFVLALLASWWWPDARWVFSLLALGVSLWLGPTVYAAIKHRYGFAATGIGNRLPQ